MKTWIFAGLATKSDVTLYISKILANTGFKVLLVDATEYERYRYSIDAIYLPQWITEFEGFDVACGFTNIKQISDYLSGTGEEISHYDFIICDVEKTGFLTKEEWMSASARVWVTTYSRQDLERGKTWIYKLQESLQVEELPSFYRLWTQIIDTKIDQYAWDYYSDSPIQFHGTPVSIYWDEIDTALQLENEHIKRLHVKPLSRQYKKSLALLLELLTGWTSVESRKALSLTERKRA
ncbi:hypothetical protein [Paenibacillus sp. Marseille-Q4541]|uniref:hypothetical protein n=1 Tax=Paenibacillus sp. Marseille-Q4541 TaxID=2831522 RepID=UPI001BAABCA4|nr:hypothetical protein [Paenibacillus sp. Marseille-Q4541]